MGKAIAGLGNMFSNNNAQRENAFHKMQDNFENSSRNLKDKVANMPIGRHGIQNTISKAIPIVDGIKNITSIIPGMQGFSLGARAVSSGLSGVFDVLQADEEAKQKNQQMMNEAGNSMPNRALMARRKYDMMPR